MTIHKQPLIRILVLFIVSLLLFQFNNCSKYKQPGLDGSSNASATHTFFTFEEDPLLNFVPTNDLCEDDLKKLFLTGYYKLVRTNCATCHMKEPDKPQFASMDYDLAYSVFKAKGYFRVSEHATSQAHKPPATGLHLLTQVASLKKEWSKGLELYNVCKELPKEGLITDPNILTTIQTIQKDIPVLAVDESAELVWDLTNELESLKPNVIKPNFGSSAKVVITISHRMSTGGEEYYTLKNPRIYDNATGVLVKGVHIKLNTRFVSQQTTFRYLDASIPPNTTADDDLSLLATGAMILLGKPTAKDNLRIAFEVLKDGLVMPPPPPSLVKFSSASVRIIDPNINNPNQYFQNFQIEANGEVSRAIVVSAFDVTETVCGQASSESSFTVSETCFPAVYNALKANTATNNAANFKFYTARSTAGSGGYNRFDWDFKFVSDSLNLISTIDSSGALIADPKGNITLKFSKDIRKETGNRLLRIRLVSGSTNGITSGSGEVAEVYVVFLKVNNPDAKANFEVTYSGLMNPTTGILGTKCIKCHNSVLFNGGYDITDWEQMSDPSRRILIPGDVMSEMYRRTNAGDPINVGKSPMPANGGLSQTDRDLIASWILSGAKNN